MRQDRKSKINPTQRSPLYAKEACPLARPLGLTDFDVK